MSLNATKQDSLFLFSSFCSLLIWLGRAFLEMDFIFLGLEVIFRLGPPLASTTCMEGIYNWMSTPIKVIAQPLYLHCHPNSHGSSSSWFPQVAFSIVSPGARRHYIFLLIAFRSVCKTITVCEERTQRKKKCLSLNPTCSPVTLTQNSSWSLSHSACCPWNESLRTSPDRCSSRPNSCTFLAYESQTSAYKKMI